MTYERRPMENGPFVLYADHVAAVAAARKQGEQDQIDLTRDWGLHQHEVGRLQGQRDEREAAWKRVELLGKDVWTMPVSIVKASVERAIKGDNGA